MDALEVLQKVARTYAELKTLSVEILSVSELEDEGSSTRTAERTKAWFEAPNKLRIQKGGRQGIDLVTDGVVSYYLNVSSDRFIEGQAQHPDFLPGMFNPDYGSLAEVIPPFLFGRIADHVASAEIAVGEAGNVRLSVTYQPRPPDAGWRPSTPVRFSIEFKLTWFHKSMARAR